MADRRLESPHDLDVERNTLGAALLGSAADLRDDGLTGDVFYRQVHRVVWEACEGVLEDGASPDLVTVRAWLKAHGKIEEVDASYLARLVDGVPRRDAANLQWLVGRLEELAATRTILKADEELQQALRTNPDALTDGTVDQHISTLDKIRQSRTKVAPWLGVEGQWAALRHEAKRSADGSVLMGLPELDGLIDGVRPGEVIGLMARPGLGKAQPLGARVLTPDGFKAMRDIVVGQEVVGSDGRPQRVIGVFDRGELPVFRVVLSDGTSTECCDDHLWFTQSRNERRRGDFGSVKTLAEVRSTLTMEGGKRTHHRIPLVSPVQFRDRGGRELHPYALGLLLGDGSFGVHSITFDNPEPDLQQALADTIPDEDALTIRGRECRVRRKVRTTERCKTYRILDAYGLVGTHSHTKFVPSAYLFGPPDVRLSVLCGLFDTDGYVTDGGYGVEYCTTSRCLRDDVCFLVRSLGGLATVVTTERPKYTYKGESRTGREAFRIFVRFPDGTVPVTSRKHTAKWRGITNCQARVIVAIEPVGVKECRCIAVTADDQLYVTDDFILTHNTVLLCHQARWMAYSQLPHVFFSLEMPAAQIVTRIVQAEYELNRHEVLARMRLGGIDQAPYRERFEAFRLVDRGGLSVSEMSQRIRRLQDREFQGRAIRAITIDHLGLIGGDRKLATYDRVSLQVREIKELAKQHNLAVILAIQVNRDAGGDGSKELHLGSARDSGVVEEAMDYLIGMRRFDRSEALSQVERERYKDVLFLKVIKSRHGTPGEEIAVQFDHTLDVRPIAMSVPESQAKVADFGGRRR